MSRVVYFVASHVNPPQIARLVRALRSGGPDSCVVINHAYRVSHLDRDLFRGLDGVEFVEPQRSPEWGDFAMTRVVLAALDWIVARRDFDWVVYLSGQDYPIRPLAEIEQFLATTAYDGFVAGRLVDPTSPGDREFVERYSFRYHALPRFPAAAYAPRALRVVGERLRTAISRAQPVVKVRRWGGHTQVGFRCARPPFGPTLPLYKGSAWWTLSRRAVAYLQQFVRDHPEVVRHYAHTFAAGESLYATILRNATTLRISADNYRYIRWVGANAHPEILTVADFEAMRASGKHFARKIDMARDAQLLDLIDRAIGCA